MKDFFDNNRIIRLFLAVFCPPLAVADRGCAIFIPVFIMYVIQIAATSTVFMIGLYALWHWLGGRLGGEILNWWFTVFSEISASEVDFSIEWFWIILRFLAWNFVAVSICVLIVMFCHLTFGLVASAVNGILGFIPILIGIIVVCLQKDKEPLRPEDMAVSIWRDGIFSMATLRRLFVGANRVVLCMIYPPLAVADMGWKKMLLVYLINLFGLYPGAAAVFFCVIKKYSSKTENKKEKSEK